MMTASTTSEALHALPGPELFEKIRAGDHAAFGALVRQCQPFAYALAMRFVWDRQEADDIVQESFVKVWDNIESYRPEQKFTTWLYAIVTRLSIDHIRSRSRWRRIFVRGENMGEFEEPADHESHDERMDTEHLIATVRSLVRHLPRTQRVVFTLRDLQDLSMEEVEEVTGMSRDTIKANLCHARRRIREMSGRTPSAPRR